MSTTTGRTRTSVFLVVVLAGACSGQAARTTSTIAGPPRVDTTIEAAVGSTTTEDPLKSSNFGGRFDVGGHELYMKCAGTGSPTVLHLHGAIPEPGPDPHTFVAGVQDRMKDTNRFCAYDRRNVAHSDTVANDYQDATDVLTDLRNLLDAAGIEPPYVLLGGSFGGILAYVYANTYPDEVVGMVLLDSMFPDEMTLEYLFPPEERFESFVEEDRESMEQINHYAVMLRASEFIGKEPAIPVTYFASEQEPWNVNDYGVPEYDEQILDVLAAYVDRFSPGKLVWMDSPHAMENSIPDEIADALREVIGLAGY